MVARFYGTNPNPLFSPSVINILSITNSFPVTITTTYDGITAAANNYITGQIVRLIIPPDFGMETLNEVSGAITVTSPSTFTMNIDTTRLDPFVVPALEPGHNGTAAQVNGYGEVASTVNGSFVNVLQALYNNVL
jgi:hypothetical protein